MDTTQPSDRDTGLSSEEGASGADELLAALDTVDPAEAPKLAEALAAALSDELDRPVTADGAGSMEEKE